MNRRTKSLWLPAMASLLGAGLAMALLQKIGVRPRLVWNGPVEMGLYLPWLAVLPFFGALGAYLSRAGGRSGLVPSYCGVGAGFVVRSGYVA